MQRPGQGKVYDCEWWGEKPVTVWCSSHNAWHYFVSSGYRCEELNLLGSAMKQHPLAFCLT